MSTHTKRIFVLFTALTATLPSLVHATNGMNIEGFGPISTAMGGASMAYDNGTAAMMNNPATLAIMPAGENRLDLAGGLLGPDVTVERSGMTAKSGGTAYLMPAAGWVRKTDRLTYGVGVFSQGGMGTEYKKDSFMSAGTGQNARSEVGVGRLIAPLAYQVNDRFNIGGSIDFVWGGLDMKMPMAIGSGQPGTFSDFLTGFGGSQRLGEASITPGLAANMGAAVAAGYDAVAINFTNGSKFTQDTVGTGLGGKLGMTYQFNDQVTLGAAYHFKTSMDDWDGDASMVLYDTNGANPTAVTQGTITVKDFQWPATLAAGVAYKPNSRWLLVGDFKILRWSGVMQDFNMVFRTGSEKADITFYQNWDNQKVVSLGGAYRVNDKLTLRAGANLSSNPIPDSYVHPLFPAIVEDHYTAGVGYRFDNSGSLDLSMVYAPEVTATNSQTDVRIKHSQLNWQLMYSYLF
ncbi:MAG: outer membrane protein transport protein [Candidatus Thiodiazotropha sp.]